MLGKDLRWPRAHHSQQVAVTTPGRAREAQPSLAVVLITGYARGAGLRDSLDRVTLLNKPFRSQELVAAIAQAWQLRHPGTVAVLPFVQPRK